MEAVPRMPMLAFELKTSPEITEFGPALKSYITTAYNEDGNTYSKECAELDALRVSAANVSRDFMGCSTLKKYFCQLKFLESRFPMGEGGQAAVAFSWEDSYTGRQITFADIRFEQASTLYNIGGLHAILGAMDNRQSPDGMKVSCTHFQCAAWAFQNLRDSYGSSAGIEFSHDFLTFQINLMLAQAQECILEKSMTDNRKSTITAKVAAQIVEYYRLALSHLDASNAANVVGSRRYKEWKKRIEMKSHYHKCVMYLHMGVQSEEHQKWGERVVWFNSALDQLNEAIKLAKNEEGDIEEALRFTMDVVGGKYNNAKKDNDFVYHEKVPPFENLPEVKGASLVKGIPFNPNDPDVAGADIFSRLVPMEAHEASSLYSEEKAKLLRQVGSKVEEYDNELAQFLASLSLDASVLEPEPFRLPQYLLEKCAALSVKPDTIQELKKAMTALSNVATDVGGMVEEIKNLLLGEEQEENEYKENYGPRSPNTTLIDIGKECALLDEQRRKGANSDVALHKAMQNHINDLQMLTLTPAELEKQLPAIDENRTPEDEAIILEMKRLMGKVDEMKKQRDNLHSQLRQQVHNDDITTVLVTRDGGDQESFFSEQLKKHEQLQTYLNQNIAAQETVLRAVTEANARFAPIRKATTETIARREGKISSLVASYEAYENLLDKSQRGIEYYKKLEEKGARLLERAQGVVKAEQEERARRISRHTPKAPSPSRPTAPKPVPATASIPGIPEGYIPSGLPAGLTGGMPERMVPPGAMPATSIPDMPRAPTLKDYLPFMKPNTFGPNARKRSNTPPMSSAAPTSMDQYAVYGGGTSLSQVPQVPSNQGPLPTSQTASPSHPGQQPTGIADTPGLTPGQTPGQPGVGMPYGVGMMPTEIQPGATAAAASSAAYQPGQHPLMPTTQQVVPQKPPASQQPAQVSPDAQVPQAGMPPQAPTASTSQNHAAQPAATDVTLPQVPIQQQPQMPPQQQPQVPLQPQQLQQPPQAQRPPQLQPQQPPHVGGPEAGSAQQLAAGMANQQQATMRDEAAHTVNMLNAPIASPEEAPSSYSGGQPTWPMATSTVASAQQPTQGTTQATAASTMPQQHPGQLVYGAQVPGAGQSVGLQVGAATSGPYAQGAPQVSQYPGYGAYPAAGQAAYPSMPVSMTGQQQYSGNTPSKTQVGGSQPQQAPGSATSVQGKYQAYPGVAQQFTDAAQAAHMAQMTTPTSTAQSTASQIASNQYAAKGTNAVSGATPTSAYQQQQYAQPGVAASTAVQPGSAQTQAGVYPQQPRQPASNAAYQKPAMPTGAVGYTGQQAYPGAVAGAYGAVVSQGYNYAQQPLQQLTPQHQQLQPQRPQQQPPQSQQPQPQQQQLPPAQPQNVAASSAQNYKYPQGYTPQLPSQTATGTAIYGQQSAMPGVSSATGAVQQPAAQTGYTVAYGQQGQYSQYQQQQQPQQVKVGYSAPGVGRSAQQAYPAYGNVRPAVPTTQQQTWQHQQAAGGGYGQVAGVQPGQYQYYNQPTQQGQQAVMPATSQGFTQYGQQQEKQQQLSQQQQQQQYPAQPQQQKQQPQYLIQQQKQPQQHQYPQQQQQYPNHLQQQYATQQQQQRYSTQQQPGYTQPQQPQYPTQAQQPQQPYPNQQPKTPQTATTGTYGQVGYGQPHIGYGQQYPGYSQGYNQYGQQYAQQTSPAHSAYGAKAQQQQQQIQQQQQQPFATQPPNQLNSSQQGPAQGQQYHMESPMSPQTNLPSPLQPIQPSPIHTNSPQPQRASSAPPEGQPPIQPQPRPIERQNSHTSTSSSLDDILSSSPDGTSDAAKKDGMLTPKVITAEDLQQQKEEELKKTLKQQFKMDPYEDRNTLDKFVSEVEKFDKMVESLDKHTLSGPTPLDKEWKDLGDEQVKSGRQQSMGIARCYPGKNRTPEVMPYDSNRVLLKGTQDDYINASFIGDLAPCCPKFITTQSPLPVTIEDFWMMVHEQGTEVIVMLCHEEETGMQKIHQYWPAEKNKPLQHGRFTLTLQSIKNKQFWVERIITLAHKEARQSRSVVHLQFLNWPPSGAPESPNQILSFIGEVHTFYIQQRTLIRPVIVHCSDGVGRTGSFCVIYTAVQEVNQGNGVREVSELIRMLRERRKYMVQEKEQLAFCYHAILYHCQTILIKRGIITNKASFGDKIPGPGEKSHQRKPSEDFILGNTTSLSAIQSSVAKMTVKASTPPPQGDNVFPAEQEGMPINGSGLIPVGTMNANDIIVPVTGEVPLAGTTGDVPVAVKPDAGPAIPAGSDPAVQGQLGSPVTQRSRSASGSSSRGSQTSLPTASPQHQGNSANTALTDLQDPEKFSLDMSDMGRPKKFNKSQFHSKTGGIQEGAPDPNDPLSLLDPLWTVKDGGSS